ncbi:hypothetical protein A3A79_02495 [Candidatus Gottesmanbacteria bacterium RIFCSPLOWO2_01_FULL_43_11b]|uniref:Uncharacterized protein n=1 Tax=Candidatus Gottesmanbacteria bacterium RIFCSPLOWO2_01_FULL_43_11b TaxID=1798392 RepID=A0A1F6AHU0_9BACT|nr:MAG: hypothetical protein A3A79_02495 [Candidatus Gottesmanbacteria bacterium RIFCSPLOWO2_01_FULL_43_11b]
MRITIDPRIFISPPYVECPKCKKPDYGVISIHSFSYTRRCRACWHTESYSLPKLKKKVIYLDQMVISEMMKLLHPTTEITRRVRVKGVWKEVFAKLDRLVKLQLIICPDSTTHLHESLVTPHYQLLRRMYEHLSNGVSFYDEETIKRFQIIVNFRKWLGKKTQEIDLYSVLHGDDIDGWQDRIRISVDMFGQDKDLPERIRSDRDQIDSYMQTVFKRWQSEKGKVFNDWYEEEVGQFGIMILKSYLQSLQRHYSAAMGDPNARLDWLLPSSTVTLVSEIQDELKEKGTPEDQLLLKTTEYFKSEDIKEVSYGRISAMLFAAVARKAASGKKKPPTRGFVNDVKTIASLAPYCDAMFVDKECHTYLKEEPVKTRLGLHTQFFSQLDINVFLNYLDKIERSASKKHLEKVKEIYGEDWGSPFFEMFEYDP